MDKYIHLDFGHGYNTTGCQSPDARLKEHEWTRAFGKQLHEALLAEGYKIHLTAPDNREPTLPVRAKSANKFYAEHKGKHIFVSIHVDAFSVAFNGACGMSVRVGTKSGEKAKKLASCVMKEAVMAVVTGNRDVPPCMYWEQNLYVCNNTVMPAILIEYGFATNRADVERLLSLEGRQQLIEITIHGINKYFDSL